jgi:hypothetical protein
MNLLIVMLDLTVMLDIQKLGINVLQIRWRSSGRTITLRPLSLLFFFFSPFVFAILIGGVTEDFLGNVI